MASLKGWGKAHVNMALVKYWGKRDDDLILPMNNSISWTLDAFWVKSSVTFDPTWKEDTVLIDGTVAKPEDVLRVTRFIDHLRAQEQVSDRCRVESVNHVPTAAGLASSSAAYAALAMAASQALGSQLSLRELSRLARRGSGSSCRSIYGGFVEWLKGEQSDGNDSYAVPLGTAQGWDLAMLAVIVEAGPKAISSRAGMRQVVQTSPFYAGWLASVDEDLMTVRRAIQHRDFSALGQAAERNALKMHATTLGANPPYTYWLGVTVDVIRRVQAMRDAGVEAYVTIDAGPHVMVLCREADVAEVKKGLGDIAGIQTLVVAHEGPGVQGGRIS